MSDKSKLGDYVKAFERRETERRFFLELPIYARLDGRCFSKFTAGMGRPYDERMSSIMRDVTAFLVDEASATVGYTQSDEISLAWVNAAQVFFDGKVQKMASLLAAMATAKFTALAIGVWPERVRKMTPTLDCRVFQVPTIEAAAACFLWRERDATKNAISMAAGAVYSHTALLHKNSDEKQEMLWQKGINFNDYPDTFKRGAYYARQKALRELSPEELARIPEKYRPTGPIERTDVRRLEIPPLSRIANRAAVLFSGAEPEMRQPRARDGPADIDQVSVSAADQHPAEPASRPSTKAGP